MYIVPSIVIDIWPEFGLLSLKPQPPPLDEAKQVITEPV